MARVIYGSLVTKFSGSIGGTTFQQNRYGFTAKNKGVPTYQRTSNQSIYRLNFGSLVKIWRSLSNNQQQAYISYATDFPQFSANDSSVALNGYNLFVAYNSLRLNAGLDPVLDIVRLNHGLIQVNPRLYQAAGEVTLSMYYAPSLTNLNCMVRLSQSFDPSLDRGAKKLYNVVINDASGVDNLIQNFFFNYFGRLPTQLQFCNLEYRLIGSSYPYLGSWLPLQLLVEIP